MTRRHSIVTACLALAACAPDSGAPEAALATFHLDVTVAGHGSVVSAPAAIDCGAAPAPACGADFAAGTHVTLQARALPGSSLLSWEGSCIGVAGEIIDLTMDADLACVARFAEDAPVVEAITHELTLVVLGPGTVDAVAGDETLTCTDQTCTRTFAENTTVSFDARPAAGAVLVGFSGDCAEGGAGDAEVVMAADRVCTASFFSNDDVTFPLRVLVVGAGRVTSTPAGVDCDQSQPDCEGRFAQGTTVTLHATADEGSSFREWGNACAGSPGTTVALAIDYGTACRATFARSLALTVLGAGTVTSVADASVDCDGFCSIVLQDSQSLELQATAAAGARFVGWSGDCVGTAATTAVSTTASACTATFEQIPPTITVIIDGGGTVTSADASIACPGTCSAEVIDNRAVVDPGQWTCPQFFFGTNTGCNCGCGLPDPDCASSASSSCLFFGDCEEAFIVEDRNHLCYVEQGGGTRTVTLTATADAGFVFASWSGDCSGSAATLVVPVPASSTCTAVFAPQ